jgi:hypothetical protein
MVLLCEPKANLRPGKRSIFFFQRLCALMSNESDISSGSDDDDEEEEERIHLNIDVVAKRKQSRIVLPNILTGKRARTETAPTASPPLPPPVVVGAEEEECGGNGQEDIGVIGHDQEVVAVATAIAATPAKKPKKKRKSAISGAEKNKKRLTVSSVAAMVSCLSGVNKHAELADLGDEVLLSAPKKSAAKGAVPPHAIPPRDASSSEHLWLRESPSFSNFVPKGTDDAFVHECNRVLQTQAAIRDFVEVMTGELTQALEDAKKLPRNHQKNEESLVRRIRNMEELLESLGKRYSTLSSKMGRFGQFLKEHTEAHMDLMRRHREFSRNLICHYTQSYCFDPDTPGSHLISDPFVAT